MGGLAQTPLPTVQYDLDFFWPSDPDVYAIGAAINASAARRYSMDQNFALWSAKVGGGTGNMNVDPVGRFVAQVASSPLGQEAFFGLPGFNIRMPYLRGGAFSPARAPTYFRIHRFQFVLQLQAPVAAVNPLLTFVVFGPNGAGNPGAAGNGYAGLFLGTDGRWKYGSRVSGAGLGFQEGPLDLGWPSSASPTVVDFVWTSATDAADGVFQIFLNQQYTAPAIQRSWGPGTFLPPYPHPGNVNATGWNVNIGATDLGVLVVVQVGDIRCMRGGFVPNGTPAV